MTGLDNVEFRLGEIEHLPVADASVDVVISNCVLNLSPDKPQVWRDIARVLKPGGRVAVSDLALLQPLPPAVAAMLEAVVGCVAGAPLVTDTERMMREAGLVEIALEPKPEYVETMSRREHATLSEPRRAYSGGHDPGRLSHEPRYHRAQSLLRGVTRRTSRCRDEHPRPLRVHASRGAVGSMPSHERRLNPMTRALG